MSFSVVWGQFAPPQAAPKRSKRSDAIRVRAIIARGPRSLTAAGLAYAVVEKVDGLGWALFMPPSVKGGEAVIS